MVTRRAWVLNFDAETELATLGRKGGPRSSRHATERWSELAARVATLLGPGDVVLPEDGGPRLGDVEGRAWCPTPLARARLQRIGARLPEAPPAPVLRAVNHRRFCAELGIGLPGARFLESLDELERLVESSSVSGPWLIKRALSFTGQGRILAPAGALSEPARAFCRASLGPGEGLSVEPFVQRDADFSLHGHLSPDRELAVGAIVRQRVGRSGIWQSAALASQEELAPHEPSALRDALSIVADALAERGFFGPFGIDAFRWVDLQGTLKFHPCCEINARYSMSWALGMGSLRPDLELQSRH